MLVPFYYIPYYVPTSTWDTNNIDINSPLDWLVIALMILEIAILLFIVFDLADELFGGKVQRLIRKLRRRKKWQLL